MKILIVHNVYQQRGGEDAVVEAESRLLEDNGHTVILYRRHNDELRRRKMIGAFSTAVGTVWATDSYRALSLLLMREKPQVAHFHNTLPLVSPAGYYACCAAGVPVVQTLHNYRLLCPAATFLRNGRICELCLGHRFAWPSVVHACYRHSRPSSAAVAGMLWIHRFMRTWATKVNLYVALSEFARRKFIQGGFASDRLVVKPNFVHNDPGARSVRGDYAFFAGRHSEAKGLSVLIRAWSNLRVQVPLRIAGDGPLRAEIEQQVLQRKLTNISFLGFLPEEETRRQMSGARFLIVPSLWFEGFPMVIAEAFALGVPVVCSRLGSLEEIVEDHKTGLHFEPDNADDLSTKIEWLWTHGEESEEMGKAARRQFEAR
ncbi:MAG TPA: glycosyltransferase family 4 protein, partial [Candidatus Angelobacter sp.]|nr:glycosyltransferase family 4 protein [Candidatus Angelobacter sp.]